MHMDDFSHKPENVFLQGKLLLRLTLFQHLCRVLARATVET